MTETTVLAGVRKDLRRLWRDPADSLRRILGWARGSWVFRGCVRGARVCAFGRVRVIGRARIRIGQGVTFLGGPVPTELVCHPGASLVIGDGATFNYGVSIEAHDRVTVGAHCEMGSFVRLGDRARTGTSPITICDRVWLAHGVVVEPGVSIGAGSVVAAASVVAANVPTDSLASGNPARALPLTLAPARK